MTAGADHRIIDGLQERVECAALAEAAWARTALRRARERIASGKPADRLLARIDERLSDGEARVELRRAAGLQLRYPEDLPVVEHRAAILAVLAEHGVLVLTGETGSGKTTQLPKMLLEAGCGLRGMIGVTQPRRVAAQSVASRIAEELAAEEGVVASAVRFDDRTADHTRIRVMTDGLLLAEAARDRDLTRYDALVIDEAHERSLNIDVLLGLAVELRKRRPQLRLIVTSATIEAERFAAYLGGAERPAPRIAVPGRLYPVEIEHRPLDDDELGYLSAAIEAVREIHAAGEPGDVLVFLPTERDILEAQRRLRDEPGLDALALFGRLNPQEQRRVFGRVRGRKVVLATNIAETSITVPGIRHVVDTGLARIKRYAPATRTERLPVEAVARASLAQRAGRAGRTGPGRCLRLLGPDDEVQRPEFTDPEIRRSNLAGVLLQHLAMGLGDPEDFPWLDAPAPGAWQQARRLLGELGALESAKRGRHALSPLGRSLARIPADPQVARILIAGIAEGVPHELCTIAAFLSIQDPRQRPPGSEGAADTAHAAFFHEAGDLATALRMWDGYREAGGSSARARWCAERFLSPRRMREWADVRHQLWATLREDRSHGVLPTHPHPADALPLDAVHRAALAGLLGNVCRNDREGRCYRAAGNREVQLHPGSALRRDREGGKRKGLPEWLVACEVVETSRTFVRLCAPIDPLWVEALAGDGVKRSYRHPRYHERGERVLVAERVTWKGLAIVDNRRVAYAAIDPRHATELFIRAALVEGRMRRPPAAVARNRVLLDRAAGLAARLRDPEVAVDDETLYHAYAQVLMRGAGEHPVASRDDLNRWLREHGEEALALDPGEIVDPRVWDRAERDAPEVVRAAGRDWRLQYRYAPGRDDDGVSLVVEEDDLPLLRAVALDRLVPGLIESQVHGYVRALPKAVRRECIPLAETAHAIREQVMASPLPVPHAVARAIGARIGRSIASPDPAALAPECRLRLVVRDDQGQVRFAGRDHEAALAGVGGSDPLAPLRAAWDTAPATEWPGDLPKKVEEHGVAGWPGLLRDRAADAGVAARVAVFASREAAAAWHRDGLLALLEARLAGELEAVATGVDVDGAEAEFGIPAGVARRQLALRALVPDDEAVVDCRDGEAFAVLEAAAARRLAEAKPILDRVLPQCVAGARGIRKRLKRGLRGLAAAAIGQAVAGDLQRLFAPGWPNRLPWPAVARLPEYVAGCASLLDLAERQPDRARGLLDRRARLLDEHAAIADLDPRLLQILDLLPLAREAAAWCEELLLAEVVGGKPRFAATPVHLRDAVRRIDEAVRESEAADRAVRGDLLDLRPALARLADDTTGRGLLKRLDATIRDLPDCSHGADLPGQRAAARELLRQGRRYIGV